MKKLVIIARMIMSIKKQRQTFMKQLLKNIEYYYWDSVGNYPQCAVPLVKVYSLPPLDSFSTIRVIMKSYCFLVSIY